MPTIPYVMKPITIPDKLVYLRRINVAASPMQKEYVMFSTKGDNARGELICHKSANEYFDNYKGKTLAIDFIITNPQNKGTGTALLNFAKNLSRQEGCNGYIVLKADPSYSPYKVPHLLYRKQGFTTFNKKTDKKMDKFIKKGKIATYKDFPTELMYYSPQSIKKTSPKNRFQKLIDKIKSYCINI